MLCLNLASNVAVSSANAKYCHVYAEGQILSCLHVKYCHVYVYIYIYIYIYIVSDIVTPSLSMRFRHVRDVSLILTYL